MLVSALPAILGLISLPFVPESPAWLSTRTTDKARKSKSPLSELFHAPLLRLTLIGICLRAIPLIGAWGASKWMIPWADKIGGATPTRLQSHDSGVLGGGRGAWQSAGWTAR